ncbi:hypothetical protein Xedl_00624 [Xenorhabdus eapokensis]|uniref:Uncharacterized protein n=1 Tax=Xenorhabdus eapokensis TaxID=1873482 RepID=A0A1Q5TYV7_9GAMM|nr:hypothetical protein Xedl_00624 [Xenorhabdus eapokensis]
MKYKRPVSYFKYSFLAIKFDYIQKQKQYKNIFRKAFYYVIWSLM